MKALVIEKGHFKNKEGKDTYYLHLSKLDRDGNLRVSKKADMKSVKFYFVDAPLFDLVKPAQAYDFAMTADPYSESVKIGDKAVPCSLT